MLLSTEKKATHFGALTPQMFFQGKSHHQGLSKPHRMAEHQPLVVHQPALIPQHKLHMGASYPLR
jgi:hypothetical protein